MLGITLKYTLISLQSSSENSDSYQIMAQVEQLDVGEDEKDVTVVAMASVDENGSRNYLLHLIAGHLTMPVLDRKNNKWKEIQTYFVGNDSLYDEINRHFEKGLSTLMNSDKKQKVLDNGPPYVVTNKYPMKTSDGEFEVNPDDDLIRPEVTEDKDGREVYTYRSGEELKLQLHEPRSPMMADYTAGDTAATHTGLIVKVL